MLASHLDADCPMYENWCSRLSLPVTIERGYDLTWRLPDDTGLVVTPQHYEEPEVTLLREAREAGIPTLVIADGVLEYRNTWLNPTAVPGALFQPVLTDKIATIGPSQARILESWGNRGVCEIVGAPRLDGLLDTRQPRDGETPFRILVATARTPGFTPDQMEWVARGLSDLKAWFERADGRVGDRDIEVDWRLTGGLAERLGVESQIIETLGMEFHAHLRAVDALITTPSTTALEGMLLGLPVAVLDYTNSPVYVPPAWAISANAHLDIVLPELLDPPDARKLFQRTTLCDALRHDGPSGPRMVALAEAMVRIGNECRSAARPLAFPDRIVTPPDANGFKGGRFPVLLDTAGQADVVELRHLRLHVREQDARIRALEKPTEGETTAPSRRGIRGLLAARLRGGS